MAVPHSMGALHPGRLTITRHPRRWSIKPDMMEDQVRHIRFEGARRMIVVLAPVCSIEAAAWSWCGIASRPTYHNATTAAFPAVPPQSSASRGGQI